MFREKYMHMNHQIFPDPELMDQVLKSAHDAETRKRKIFRLIPKPVAAAGLICLCISVAAPTLAATSDFAYHALYQISPGAAQFFIPVQKSDDDNGIRMEVISAYLHGNTAEIYIAMQDLTGDRIDSSTDLYDSYSINRAFDSSASCRLVEYDEATKTATFLIMIQEQGSGNMEGDKITFSVREFLSHKNYYENIEIPVDLPSFTAGGRVQTVAASGGGGMYYEKHWNESSADTLVPGQPMKEFPVDGIDLTGIGYIDGRLHVQTAVPNRLENDNHGFFYLKDAEGNDVNEAYGLYFISSGESGRVDYHESVFDIPAEEIAAYKLYGNFVTAGMRTEGNWRVTFQLEREK